jgi:alpha-beta hydrolase superfamily lysophospholipase
MLLGRLVWRMLKWGAVAVALIACAIVGVRAVQALSGPELRLWHTVQPPELEAADLARTDWAGYLAAEQRAFQTVAEQVTAKLPEEDQVPANRYFAASPLNPTRFATDWNRSFLVVPQGRPPGAVVLLHGMTDAPFSMRHLAVPYAERGWLVLAPRMPGHGTVPAGLAAVHWQDWMAATRLAVREARARIGPDAPIHLVGYSNGGALALKHALDAIEEPRLQAPDRIVLVSPMIGVTAFARFAGIAALPALLPRFAPAAWLGVLPEFNPFKYNSFPVNAARQSYELTAALQEQIRRLAGAGRLDRLAPVLAFQSVVDSTVSTRAVVAALFELLPANGSELVLFDLNRDAKVGPLIAAGIETAIERLLPPAPRRYDVTLVTNASPDSLEAVARHTAAGGTGQAEAPLGLAWSRELFSLSHIALPFPEDDGLYGMRPDPADRFGIALGALAVRGETGVLVTGLDSLLRVSANPFFPYLRQRIADTIGTASTRPASGR